MYTLLPRFNFYCVQHVVEQLARLPTPQTARLAHLRPHRPFAHQTASPPFHRPRRTRLRATRAQLACGAVAHHRFQFRPAKLAD